MGSAAGAQQKKYRNRHNVWTVGDEAFERAQGSRVATPEYKPRFLADAHKSKRKWKNARRAVESSLLAESAACNELWANFEVELRRCLADVAGQLSDSQEQVRSMLLAAIMVRDSNQLGVLMHKATTVGLRFQSKTLHGLLESLLVKEDLEGFWRCLSSALLEEDVLTLKFWREEAKEKHIQLPDEILDLDTTETGSSKAPLADGSSSAEKHRLEELMKSFEICVQDAYSLRDMQQLNQLYIEAKRVGINSEMVEAAIIGLGAELPDLSEQARNSSKSSYSNAHNADNSNLMNLNVAQLKDELNKLGVDFKGIFEKEELVKLLQAARISNHSDKRDAGHNSGTKQPSTSTAEKAGFPKVEKRSNVYDTLGGSSSQNDKSKQKAQNASEGDKKQWTRPGAAGKPPPAPQSAQRSESEPKKEPPKQVAKDCMTFAEARTCLGIMSQNPTADEVRVAYKKAALKWHPDRKTNHGKEAEATKKFQEARTAFELLQRVSST